MSADKYCIDTSALIHAWRRSYPIRNFQPVWSRIDDLIEAERFISSIEVLIELEKRDDDLFEWAKERESIFLDIEGDDLQIRMAEILGSYPRLVDTRKNRSAADPFVIAMASLYDPPLVVVTQEGPTGKIEKPHIPDVCTAEGLNCISILELIVREDWRLG